MTFSHLFYGHCHFDLKISLPWLIQSASRSPSVTVTGVSSLCRFSMFSVALCHTPFGGVSASFTFRWRVDAFLPGTVFYRLFVCVCVFLTRKYSNNKRADRLWIILCIFFSINGCVNFFFLPVVVVETGHEVSTSDASVEFSEHMIIYWKTNSLLNMRKSIKMFPFRWLSHYIVYTSHCVC